MIVHCSRSELKLGTEKFNEEMWVYFSGDDKMKKAAKLKSKVNELDKSTTTSNNVVPDNTLDGKSSSQLIESVKEASCWREVTVSEGE